MTAAKYLKRVEVELQHAGLVPFDVLEVADVPRAFDNARVVVRVGPVLFRTVRDRGQDRVEIGSISAPLVFHEAIDVAVALGWEQPGFNDELREPEPLSTVFHRFAAHWQQLVLAVSPDRLPGTLDKLEVTLADRRRRTLRRLGLNPGDYPDS